MNRSIRKVIAVTTLVIALLALTGSTVFAQASECGKKRNVGNKALDEATWNQLNRVYEDVGEKRYDKAYQQLQKMLNRAGRAAYLRSVLNQALAQVEWSRENHDSALKYFEKVVELEAMKKLEEDAREKFLIKAAGQSFYNTSPMDLFKLSSADIKSNLLTYVDSFSRV